MKKLAILFLVLCSNFALGQLSGRSDLRFTSMKFSSVEPFLFYTDLCPAGYWTWQRFADVSGTNHDRICVKYSDASLLFLPVGSTSPADPDTSVQFNNGGLFGGDARFTWSNSSPFFSQTLALSGRIDVRQNSADPIEQVTNLVGVRSNANSAPAFGVTFPTAYSFQSNSVGNDGDGTITDAAGVEIEDGYTNGGTSTITNLHGILIKPQTAGTNNFGIKIGDIGDFLGGDYSIYTGFGNVAFGEGLVLFDMDGSSPVVGESVQFSPELSVYIGDASTNSHTVRHTHFYTGNHYPGMVMSADAGTGAVPNFDMYGNTNHTYFDSGIFTITNNSGVSSSITTNHTGGDFPETGNSIGLTISANGSGANNTGLALELTGSGTGYEKSIALQIDSGGRAFMSGGVQLNTTNSQPTCNSNIRGTFWDLQGALGVADLIQVCMKDVTNAYAWHTVTIP